MVQLMLLFKFECLFLSNIILVNKMTNKVDLLGNEIAVSKQTKQKKRKTKVKKQIQTLIDGVSVYIPKDDYMVPSNVPQLIRTEDIANIYTLIGAHLNTGVPLLLEGPKGTAKTLAVAKYCEENEIPLIQFDCSEQTKRYDIMGRFIPVDDKVVFQLGDLPRAIQLANTYGQAMIVFEEINALTPNMQKVLNQLFDWRNHVYVPEIGQTFKLKEGCKLGIAATCNPSTYGGTFELNEDLLSRLTIYKIGYPTKNTEVSILEQLFDSQSESVSTYLDCFAALAGETRNGYNRNEFSYALSTRDIVQMLTNFLSYKEEFSQMLNCDDPELDALELVKHTFLSKYNAAEKETLETRWKSIFGSVA